ncbi:glucosamine inositolphosphorylceramide transferase family protein [Acidiphilium sp.]|uniref:glucosamine inositolphosphorylceramide transferase family protein n=1 Tax=Acidiphilium sp. TaxID=527 RepID=UPI003CFCA5BB
MSTRVRSPEPAAAARQVWRDRLLCEWWSIGICARPIGAILDHGALGPVRWLEPTQGRAYRADPFAWPGTDLILCEEVPLVTGIGRIVALRERGGRFEPVGTLLDDGVHRSYPFIWRDGEEMFMLPEAVAGGPTILYRLTPPGTLEALATIAADRRLVDATMFAANGHLWIAATDLAFGSDNNLCLFHANHPGGPWHAHAANPVITGRRTARSGGTPFQHRGRWYRPAQDCTETYGGALVIAEILTLTPTTYRERIVCRLAPDPTGPFPHGLHTLSADGERCLIDGKRMIFAPRVVAGKIRRRMFRTRQVERRTP